MQQLECFWAGTLDAAQLKTAAGGIYVTEDLLPHAAV